MKIVLRLCFWTAATLAWTELAAVSDQYSEFGKGPARFVMTRDEISTWKTVKSDVEAKEFIDRFWARRSPAFHVLFDQAVEFADQKLTRGKRRGSLTDMGKVLVIMGPPSRQREYKGSAREASPLHAEEIDTRAMGTGNFRCWIYEAESTKLPLDSEKVEICFDDRYGKGEWRLLADPNRLFERVNRSRLLPPISPTPSPTSTPNP